MLIFYRPDFCARLRPVLRQHRSAARAGAILLLFGGGGGYRKSGPFEDIRPNQRKVRRQPAARSARRGQQVVRPGHGMGTESRGAGRGLRRRTAAEEPGEEDGEEQAGAEQPE